MERFAAESRIALSVTAEADSYGTLKDPVRHGHGWTILPTAPIYGDIADGSLTVAPRVDPTPEQHLVLSFPADRPVPRLARFADEAIVAENATRGIWPSSRKDGRYYSGSR